MEIFIARIGNSEAAASNTKLNFKIYLFSSCSLREQRRHLIDQTINPS